MVKYGKDMSNGIPKIKLWNYTKKHFPVFAKIFRKFWRKLIFLPIFESLGP